MKHTKRILMILLLALLIAALTVLANAEGEVTIVDSGYCGGEGDGTNLTWTLDSEGTLTISGEGEMGTGFYDRNDIVSVIIESGVISISDYAFARCTSLSNIVMPDSVTYVGVRAFVDCSSLISFTVPKNVYLIPFACFSGCINLKSISLNNNLIGIAGNAFDGCGLESIELTRNLLFLGLDYNEYDEINEFFDYARDNGMTLKEISDVGKLDQLATRYFEESYPFCGAFKNCFALTSIKVAEDNPFFSTVDGCLYSKDQSVFIKYPEGKKGDTYQLSARVKTIDTNAFQGNNYLKELVIPDTVDEIYSGAFSSCVNLKKIYIMNRDCKILRRGDSLDTYSFPEDFVSDYTTVYGYRGSTAEKLALLNNCNFVAIEESTPSTTTAQSASSGHTESTDKPTTQPSEEKPAEKLSFFQRLIQWIKDLFAKLFGKK